MTKLLFVLTLCSILLASLALLRSPTVQPDSSVDSASLEQLAERIEELEATVAALAGSRDAAAVPPQSSSSGVARPTVPEPANADAPIVEAVDEEAQQLLDDLVSQLPLDERQSVLRSLGKKGLLKKATEELRELVDRYPNDPDAHYLLGNSLASSLRAGGVSAKEAADLARDARKSLSDALEQDPEHWEARFTRAMLNAFAPGASGRQIEAISDLKRLAENQDHSRPERRDASTWYFLGNLYLQQQQREKARSAWSTGARLFPEDQRFSDKLGSLDEIDSPAPGQDS